MNKTDLLYTEQTILGNIISFAEESKIALESLNEDCFVDPRDKAIFNVAYDLYQKHTNEKGPFELDEVVILENLKARKLDQVCGGVGYIKELIAHATLSDQIEEYIKLLKNSSLVRKLIETMEEMRRKYAEEPIEYSQYLGEVEDAISKITKQRQVTDFTNMDVSLNTMLTILGDTNSALSSGYRQLDYFIEGFVPGSLCTLGARTGVGKTAIALNFACRMVRSGKGVGIFSLEMPCDQIVGRFLQSEAYVTKQQLKEIYGPKADLKNPDIIALKEAVNQKIEEMRGWPVYIDDSPALSINEIKAKSRKLKAACPTLGLIIVDYIGLVKAEMKGANFTRQQELGAVSHGLKELAKSLGVAVLALTQLNRGVDNRGDHRPNIADIRESGDIEQDSDQIFLLYRPDYYKTTEKGKDGNLVMKEQEQNTNPVSEVIFDIAKNRHGKTGIITFQFDREHCRFEVVDEDAKNLLENDNQ